MKVKLKQIQSCLAIFILVAVWICKIIINWSPDKALTILGIDFEIPLEFGNFCMMNYAEFYADKCKMMIKQIWNILKYKGHTVQEDFLSAI